MAALDRRTLLGAGALGLLGQAMESSAAEATAPLAAAPTGAFTTSRSPQPLPFAAGALRGLSERLIQSHWENNYSGAVKALNTVRSRLSQALADPDAPPYVYNGLKREQLYRTGSVVLHELYFDCLGGDGRASGSVRSQLAQAFGSFDAWEVEFRKIGQGLAGGSGWVLLGFNTQLRVLENHWMADHATAPVGTVPVLALDLYEHAFHMDYGAAAARYIDAFFANLHWERIGARLMQSMRA